MEIRVINMWKRMGADIRNYGIAILVVLGFYVCMHALFQAFCPMVLLTGFPCPGCGLTRSILFFLTGQWERSFYLQPLGGGVALFLLYCAWFRYVRGKRVPAFMQILVGFVAAAVILYLIRMYFYFPNRPPYTYKTENLLAWLLGER